MARAVAGRATNAFLTLLAGSTAATLSGCAAVPSSTAGAPAAPASLAERLPAVAAGFRKGEARTLPADAAEGREVAYSTGGGRSTAAAIVELLPGGTAAEAALDAALAEVSRASPAREMQEAGRFVAAAPRDGAPATAPLFCAETAGRYGRERVVGLVCAGRAGGVLLRIRVTMPARQPAPADPRAFAEAIAASLSDPATAAPARPG